MVLDLRLGADAALYLDNYSATRDSTGDSLAAPADIHERESVGLWRDVNNHALLAQCADDRSTKSPFIVPPASARDLDATPQLSLLQQRRQID
jgi:hypothetical protein